MKKIMYYNIGLLLVFSALLVGCQSTENAALINEGAKQYSEIEKAEPLPSIFLEETNLRGCCSWNDGVKGSIGNTVLCNNFEKSRTCKVSVRQSLQGCCSSNGGIDYADAEGIIFCNRGGPSKTCKLSYSSSN